MQDVTTLLGGLTFPESPRWRDDRLYDVVVVLGVNDSLVVASAGSAIFLHIAAPDYSPTRGCVALSQPDLLELLKGCDARARLWVQEEGPD